jgi:transketolase
MDAVQSANSGHPGMPMGMAPAAYWLWAKHLKHNPANPNWEDRDRFVLSAGHGSALLYSLLHLSGYGLTLEDLSQFRQWGSKTPGHPEFGHTIGVELTTGPLGAGISTAVGLAMAEAHLAERFNKESANVVDHTTWVIAGDGCLQEGISSEASSLAGHLGLGKLIVIYDDNQITIDGNTELSFTEDVKARYESYNWQVIEVAGDGNDLAAIDQAFLDAKAETQKPTLIKLATKIGFGSPNKQGSHSVHGSPLGDDEIKLTKQALGYTELEPFTVPSTVYEHMQNVLVKGEEAQAKWDETLTRLKEVSPATAEEYAQQMSGELPIALTDVLPSFDVGTSVATRSASGAFLNAAMPSLPSVLGGSADLTPSNNTHFQGAVDFQQGSYAGRYVRYGVREHAMGAVLNGLNVHGGLRAYAGTFLVFADYMRPQLRLAALSKYPSIFVFTHDSIGVGEDGPTHQPVETVASLRSIIGLRVFRPCDANETTQAWQFMLENKDAPATILLSRQNLPIYAETGVANQTAKGAYALNDVSNPDVLLMASGSEVQLAVEAEKELLEKGIRARVISVPCMELFEEQSESYKAALMPASVKARVAIEAGIDMGWHKYLGTYGKFVGMSSYGASAPGATCFEKFGFTKENVIANAMDSLATL